MHEQMRGNLHLAAPAFTLQLIFRRNTIASDAATLAFLFFNIGQASAAALLPEPEATSSIFSTASTAAPVTSSDTLPAPAASENSLEEVLLEVRINHQEPEETVMLLRDSNKKLLANAEDLKRWRLQLASDHPVMQDGMTFHRLDALAGMSYTIDQVLGRLDIDAKADLFDATVLEGIQADNSAATVATPGGFFNYDLFTDSAQSSTRVSGLFEAGAFGRWGTAVTSFVGNSQAQPGERLIRLDSTLTQDFPGALKSLRFGDVSSGASSWARSVRLGGIQWSSNFALQPGFMPFPLPGMSGQAALPSTVDYYFNGELRVHRDVPSGPFSIQDLPVLNGQGDARLVVRDLLGHEQIITQHLYTNTQLLRQGLTSYSYELGFLRNNAGVVSNDYAQIVATGTHRIGLTERLTAEVHEEILFKQQSAGLSGTYIAPKVGVLSLSAALSHGTDGSGGLLASGIDRQFGSFSFGANTQLSSTNFAQLGFPSGTQPPRQASKAFISLGTMAYGYFFAGYTVQQWSDKPEVQLTSASYGSSLGKLGFLGISYTHITGPAGKTVLSLNLTVPLGAKASATMGTPTSVAKNYGSLQMQQSLPAGSGFGYRLMTSLGQSSRQEADIRAQNDIGTYGLALAHANGESAVRANASGGLAILGENAFFSRRISDSFAIIKVPGYANVRVLADNQLVATTNAKGIALLPNLRPYQKNAIRIDEADLPLDARIDATSLNAIPYFRSGVMLNVPVKQSRGGIIKVLLDDGAPLPAGAVAQIIGEKETFPSGFGGEIYLMDLQQENQISVSWRGQLCQFSVPFPPTDDPVPDLGVFQCVKVQR